MRSEDGRELPIVAIRSPNLGRYLRAPTDPDGEWFQTSDLGEIDDGGRLRLLGRADDHRIGGLWPKHSLDLLGDVLQEQSALVRHPARDSIHVKTLVEMSPARRTAVRDVLSRAAGVDPNGETASPSSKATGSPVSTTSIVTVAAAEASPSSSSTV